GLEVAGDVADAPETAQRFEHAAIVVTPAEGEKCERCWTVTTTVGSDSAHPTLCARCADVVKTNYVQQ
ncbi:hypothetical protein KZ287_29250, partial [Escherichia coli]|nr:hypothetical protein [Escherichia coli]